MRLLMLLVVAVFLGCTGSHPPPGTGIVAIPGLDATKAAAQAIVEASPEVGTTVMSHLDAANAAIGEEQVTELLAMLDASSELSEEQVDLSKALIEGLEKDLAAMAAVGAKDVTSDKEWNMKCIGGGNFDCEVERGRYCVKLYYKDRLVGCASGKFAP